MAQVTIHLDAETERRAKDAAKSAGLPLSRWIAEVVRERTGDKWPQAILDLHGAWPDFPEPDALRRPGLD